MEYGEEDVDDEELDFNLIISCKVDANFLQKIIAYCEHLYSCGGFLFVCFSEGIGVGCL